MKLYLKILRQHHITCTKWGSMAMGCGIGGGWINSPKGNAPSSLNDATCIKDIHGPNWAWLRDNRVQPDFRITCQYPG